MIILPAYLIHNKEGVIIKESVETMKLSLSMILGFFSTLMGGSDELLTLLIVLIIADFLTGFIRAFALKRLSPNKMFIGGMKKLAIFIMVIVGVQMEIAFQGTIPFRETIIFYYIATEGLSFIENIGYFIPLPDKLTNFFIKLKSDQKNKKGDNDE